MTSSAMTEQPQATPELSLAACLLLAGSLRPSPLTAATRCSVLDLHLNGRETVLDSWIRHFEAIADSVGQSPLVQVIHGIAIPPGQAQTRQSRLELRLQQDAHEYRGPAGAVRDACQAYGEDSTIVIAEAARYVTGDLTRMIADHVRHASDITVGINRDSTPAGLFVVRCSTLALIQAKGFTDLKEQWLRKAVETGKRVRVSRLENGYSYELRTREGFLRAAGVAGGLMSLAACSGDVATVPTGAPRHLSEDVTIGDRAVVVDSVVMPGATIGEDAVVARSIVCGGARVASGGTVIDGVVPAGRENEG
jgi:hypothetical protein